jgi:hypothetical protein
MRAAPFRAIPILRIFDEAKAREFYSYCVISFTCQSGAAAVRNRDIARAFWRGRQ